LRSQCPAGRHRFGRTNFSDLQAELAAGRQDRLVFYAFDLLYLNGFDLRGARQIQRKTALENLLEGIEAPVVYSEHLSATGRRCLNMLPS
jgi:bifunctional non-homologous end joining protein LigD